MGTNKRDDFDDMLLEDKRKKFIEVVHHVCKAGNLPIPYINFDYCPDENENELAHCHSDTGTICVSKRQLTMLNFDDIEKTAIHEVTHFFELSHGPKFRKLFEDIKTYSWEPPGGTVVINGSDASEQEEEEPTKKPRIDKTRCNYHLCRKRRKLTQCEYCGEFFCREHKDAKLPSMAPFVEGITKRERIFIEMEYRKQGHPCPPYVDVVKQRIEEKKIRWAITLDHLLGKPIEKSKLHIKKLPKIITDIVSKPTPFPRKKCKVCGKKEHRKLRIHTCFYCQQYVCDRHLKPEAHNCPKYTLEVTPPKPPEIVKSCQVCGKQETRKRKLQTCNFCKGKFCKKHIRYEAHSCPKRRKPPKKEPPQIEPEREELKKRCLICDEKAYQRCSYCGDYFCNSHLKPEAHKCPIAIPPPKTTSPLAKILILIFILAIGAVYFLGNFTSEPPTTSTQNQTPPQIQPPDTTSPSENNEKIKSMSINGFSYINKIRKTNGKNELRWDDDLYDLASFRAKDMYDRGYFDHVTPDGKSVDDYASDFNIHTGVGENIAEGYYNLNATIDGWMTSKGHKENILSSLYQSGAVTYYRDIYVYLATGPDLFLTTSKGYSGHLDLSPDFTVYFDIPYSSESNDTVSLNVSIHSIPRIIVYFVPSKEDYEHFLRSAPLSHYHECYSKIEDGMITCTVDKDGGLFLYNDATKKADINISIFYS